MLENHCISNAVRFETKHEGACQNERGQLGGVEPIYFLFIFPKSRYNLLARIKTAFLCTSESARSHTVPNADISDVWLCPWSIQLMALLHFPKIRVIFRNCYFAVLINPVSDGRAASPQLRR